MLTISTDLLLAFQARVARGALGALGMRSSGARDAMRAGRAFLAEVDLGGFRTASASRFRDTLDGTTAGLQDAFPAPARHWGLARKGLNLFLRDCLTHAYLRDTYSLQIAEEFFEVPLDTVTGTMLYEISGGGLPHWSTLKELTPDVSDAFQDVAAQVAAERGIARVHLDAIWWSQRAE